MRVHKDNRWVGGFGLAMGGFDFAGDFTRWVWFCHGYGSLLLILLPLPLQPKLAINPVCQTI